MKILISTAVLLLGLLPGQVHAAPIDLYPQVQTTTTNPSLADLSPTQYDKILLETSEYFNWSREETEKLLREGELRIERTDTQQVRVVYSGGINEDFLDVML